jgi:ribosomal-protein-alanine N-acetyltransferase
MNELQKILPGVRIEMMREADISAVEAIEQQCGLIPWGADSYRFDLKGPHSVLLVARAQRQSDLPGEVIGFLNGWIVADEFQLNNIGVSPLTRRQGIGSSLLLAALELAQMRGAVRGVLEVRASNTVAQALYRRFGFASDGIRTNYYHNPPDHGLLMSCEIREGSPLLQRR